MLERIGFCLKVSIAEVGSNLVFILCGECLAAFIAGVAINLAAFSADSFYCFDEHLSCASQLFSADVWECLNNEGVDDAWIRSFHGIREDGINRGGEGERT